MRAIQGWMCGTDFTCELGAASGGNVVYPTRENLIENRDCVSADDNYCAPTEVYVMSREDLETLLNKANMNPSEFRIANWENEVFS